MVGLKIEGGGKVEVAWADSYGEEKADPDPGCTFAIDLLLVQLLPSPQGVEFTISEKI